MKKSINCCRISAPDNFFCIFCVIETPVSETTVPRTSLMDITRRQLYDRKEGESIYEKDT
jgi:hypothetical protein